VDSAGEDSKILMTKLTPCFSLWKSLLQVTIIEFLPYCIVFIYRGAFEIRLIDFLTAHPYLCLTLIFKLRA